MAQDILVVADDPSLRQTLAASVRRCGYEVSVAGSGEEALARLSRIPCAVVVSEAELPRMSGLDLLREVRARFTRLPVILVIDQGGVDQAVQAVQTGAQDILTRPLHAERVADALERALEARGETVETGTLSLAGIVTRDPQMLALLRMAARLAQSSAPVLIQGESGTGKELLAREIHLRSPRRDRPFVALNCAAIPESLLESELFGHERGAFTGAIARRMGKFQTAHQGTLLLDEVSETSLPLQAKLLRALQEGELDPVGRDRPVRVDVRVVATTNRSLREELQAGRFRADLFFRLNVLTLRLPPLRDRLGDIPLLARHFIEKHRAASDSPVREASDAALRHLAGYPWPGNVRELESCIHRSLLLCTERVLQPPHLPLDLGLVEPPQQGGTRSAMERRLILSTLERVGGNRTRAAEALGISVRTIRNRLRQYREETTLQVASPMV
jgi:two-component system response regulator FlrC